MTHSIKHGIKHGIKHKIKDKPLTANRLPTYLKVLLWLIILVALAACNQNEPTPTPVVVDVPVAVDGTPTTPDTNAPDAPAPTQAAPAETAVPTPTPLTGRVVIWHSWAQAEGDALAAILTQLRATHPGIQIDTLFVAPDDLVARYAEAVAAGSGPDLVLAPNWWLRELIDANAILNLDTLVGGNLDASYWPAAVASMRHNGSLYGFPLTYNLVALYVNNALVPAEGVPTDTTTLLTAAQANPTAGIGIYATLLHAQWGFAAYGAQFMDAQGVVTLDQSSGAADYLTWLNSVNSTPGSYVNSDYGMLLDRFKKNEFSYLIDGPWAMAELRAVLGDSLSVTTLPAGPAGAAQGWLYSDGLFVNPTISPQQQILALNVALIFSSDEAATTLATVGNLLPAARNADLSATPLLQGFANQAAAATAMPTGAEMNNVWTYGDDMLIKSLAGVAEPAIIVAETATLINEANGR